MLALRLLKQNSKIMNPFDTSNAATAHYQAAAAICLHINKVNHDSFLVIAQQSIQGIRGLLPFYDPALIDNNNHGVPCSMDQVHTILSYVD